MQTSNKFNSIFLFVVLQIVSFNYAWCQTSELDKSRVEEAHHNPVKGFLYEVRNGKQIAHIYGSTDITKKNRFPLSHKIDSAFEEANTLLIATDFTNSDALRQYSHKILYKSPDNSANHLKTETWKKFSEKFDSMGAGNPLIPAYIAIAHLKKMASVMIGLDTNSNLDFHFLGKAKALQLEVVEFENLDIKANFINSITDEESNDLVENFLNENGGFLMLFEQLLASEWENGDDIEVERTLSRLQKKTLISKRIQRENIEIRNKTIANRLVKLMSEEKRVFALIDVNHLFGEKNIIEYLRTKNYEIIRMK
jgi:uncharacterized protein YbaP (TraB family)